MVTELRELAEIDPTGTVCLDSEIASVLRPFFSFTEGGR